MYVCMYVCMYVYYINAIFHKILHLSLALEIIDDFDKKIRKHQLTGSYIGATLIVMEPKRKIVVTCCINTIFH